MRRLALKRVCCCGSCGTGVCEDHLTAMCNGVVIRGGELTFSITMSGSSTNEWNIAYGFGSMSGSMTVSGTIPIHTRAANGKPFEGGFTAQRNTFTSQDRAEAWASDWNGLPSGVSVSSSIEMDFEVEDPYIYDGAYVPGPPFYKEEYVNVHVSVSADGSYSVSATISVAVSLAGPSVLTSFGLEVGGYSQISGGITHSGGAGSINPACAGGTLAYNYDENNLPWVDAIGPVVRSDYDYPERHNVDASGSISASFSIAPATINTNAVVPYECSRAITLSGTFTDPTPTNVTTDSQENSTTHTYTYGVASISARLVLDDFADCENAYARWSGPGTVTLADSSTASGTYTLQPSWFVFGGWILMGPGISPMFIRFSGVCPDSGFAGARQRNFVASSHSSYDPETLLDSYSYTWQMESISFTFTASPWQEGDPTYPCIPCHDCTHGPSELVVVMDVGGTPYELGGYREVENPCKYLIDNDPEFFYGHIEYESTPTHRRFRLKMYATADNSLVYDGFLNCVGSENEQMLGNYTKLDGTASGAYVE